MSGAPVDPRLRALYDAERASAADIPEGAADRVLEGVSAKLAAGATAGAAGSSAALLACGGLAAAAAVALGIGIFAALDGASPPAPEQVTGHMAADATVGAGLARDLDEREQPAARLDAAPALELTAAPDSPTPSSRRERPRTRRRAAWNADEEWTLVERARIALRSGHAPEAIDLLEAHAERHPRGALTEERERLAIEALVASGRVDDARRRADDFRRRHPGSLHQREIDRLLRR